MSWFVIATVLGFGMYWAWRLFRPTDVRSQAKIIATAVAAFAIVGTGSYLLDKVDVGNMLASIGEGSIARFLIGIVLGIWTGIASEGRGTARIDQPATNDAAVPTNEAAGATPGIKPQFPYLAIGLVLLAIVAPHLDQWLSHLAGLKTSVIEVQLTNITTANRTIRPDIREAFVDENILALLNGYALSVEQDLAFITDFELPSLNKKLAEDPGSFEIRKKISALKMQADSLNDLQMRFIQPMLSPLAGCVQTAIKSGWNIDSLRESIRPMGNALTQLIRLEKEGATLRSKDETDAKKRPAIARNSALTRSSQDQLQTLLNEIFEETLSYVDSDSSQDCETLGKAVADAKSIPAPIAKYESLPHIHLIRASLLWFINSDRLALQVFQDATEKLKFDDLTSPFINAMLMYYQGDRVEHFMGLVEKSRTNAEHQQEVIRNQMEECSPHCSEQQRKHGPELSARARRADLRAINLAAYAIAEDAAQGLKPAEALLPVAEEYSKKLIEAANAPGFADYRIGFLDTAAFVVIVSEAKKSIHDPRRLKDALDGLEKALVLEEARVSAVSIRHKGELIDLKLIRSHIATARELLE